MGTPQGRTCSCSTRAQVMAFPFRDRHTRVTALGLLCLFWLMLALCFWHLADDILMDVSVSRPETQIQTGVAQGVYMAMTFCLLRVQASCSACSRQSACA